jgi:hypothetical protein
MFAASSIIIYELPTFSLHAHGVGGVLQQGLVLFGAHSPDSLFTSIPGGFSKLLDYEFTPFGKPHPGPANALRATDGGAPWPNVIVEV